MGTVKYMDEETVIKKAITVGQASRNQGGHSSFHKFDTIIRTIYNLTKEVYKI